MEPKENKTTFNIYDVYNEIEKMSPVKFNKNSANFYIEMNPDNGNVCSRLEFVRRSLHDKCYKKEDIANVNHAFAGREFVKLNTLEEELEAISEYLRQKSYIEIVEISEKHNPFSEYVVTIYEHAHVLLKYAGIEIPCRIAKSDEDYYASQPEDRAVSGSLYEAIMSFVLKQSSYGIFLSLEHLKHIKGAAKNEVDKDKEQKV